MIETYETEYKGCLIRTCVDEDGDIVVSADKPNLLGIGLPKLGICEGDLIATPKRLNLPKVRSMLGIGKR